MGKILIHKSNIHKVFVSDVVLNKDHVVPTITDEVIREDALFYSKMKKLISLEYGTNLATKDEAMDYILTAFDGGCERLKELLANPEITEEDRKKIISIVSNVASCLYVNPKESEPFIQVSGKDFKILQKNEKERNHD